MVALLTSQDISLHRHHDPPGEKSPDFVREQIYLAVKVTCHCRSSWLKGIGTNALHTVGETVAGFRPNDDMVKRISSS